MQSGVERAIERAAKGGTFYAGAVALAELLGVQKQFIYSCKRKGWFPVERARVISDTYGIPLVDLVRADVRAAIQASNS